MINKICLLVIMSLKQYFFLTKDVQACVVQAAGKTES
jgi:hypothetical protein